jgi:hypothetical protein
MAQRLVVELNSKAYSDLEWLTEHKELNKTTITNQALQIMRVLTEAQENGGTVVIETRKAGEIRSVLKLL